MSPISNNKLVCKFASQPFTRFFQQGLNISLSTDDPLMLHMTDEPLIEEFAIAAQVPIAIEHRCSISATST
jgi:AMP deaminase